MIGRENAKGVSPPAQRERTKNIIMHIVLLRNPSRRRFAPFAFRG
ncbi:MAG: hypothetical protein K0Q77_2560 [Anaerosporomusa subterranea]|jgi:hypothetical protein|nr:hypothetical protein [Anaerosporomusa subterranea]